MPPPGLLFPCPSAGLFCLASFNGLVLAFLSGKTESAVPASKT